jgi:hypothetical protein
MQNEELIEKIRRQFERMSGVLNERGRRVWAVAEAEALGYGGQSIVAKATGLSRVARHREGTESGEDPFPLASRQLGRIRSRGGGRKNGRSKRLDCCWRWKPWWNRPRGVLRKARFAGPVGARGTWPLPWPRRAIESVTRPWPLGSMT